MNLLALDMDQLERALQGGPALLLLCAVVILGGGVVPFLTVMWVRAERKLTYVSRELLQEQLKQQPAIIEVLITSRDAVKGARAAMDACTRVLRAILERSNDVSEGGDKP